MFLPNVAMGRAISEMEKRKNQDNIQPPDVPKKFKFNDLWKMHIVQI